MNEINLIDLYIAFGLIIIRLEKLLSHNLFFFLLCCPFLFWAYFILQGLFWALLLIKYGLMTRGRPDFNKDSRIL